MDVAIRQGTMNENIPLPFVPGCNFVGIVQCCGPEAASNGVFVGTRVAAFVKYGGNQRYVSIPYDKLMPVPNKVDASEAACILSTHIIGFQALHHGMGPSFRYSANSLRGRIVLVTNGATPEGQTVIRLASWAGAREVYTTANASDHEILRRLGAIPLAKDPDDWRLNLEGLVDVIVDLSYPTHYASVQSAMKPEGRLICYSRRSKDKEPGFSWFTEMENWYTEASLALVEGASFYDPYESLSAYPEQFRRDVGFLFSLLEQRQIRPKIEQYVSLKCIPNIHKKLESPKFCRGAIICVPWNEIS